MIAPVEMRRVVVAPEHAGERLDLFLVSTFPEFTRAYLQTRISSGDVVVDERVRKASFRLRGGEIIRIAIPPAIERGELVPEPMPLAILYEDSDVIVIDKPSGLVVHPGAGNWTGTLVHGILAHAPEVRTNDEVRPGIVHRLDKETSGVLIVAKHDMAREFLARQLRDRTAKKNYLALVHDQIRDDVTVEAPIARDPLHRVRMAVVASGRHATSIFHPIEQFARFTLVDVDLRTGRTHQIRVHALSIGHPVAGDRLYAPRRLPPVGLTRQFLHAARLAIMLPSGEQRVFESPLPPDLTAVLSVLR